MKFTISIFFLGLAAIFNVKFAFSQSNVKDVRNGRNTITRGKWPSTEIPVHIDTFYTTTQRAEIVRAMEMIEEQSCINFVTYNPTIHIDWIHVRPNEVETFLERRCNAQFGYQGGYQSVNVPVRTPGDDCFGLPGRISHQLLHSLGFSHMHVTSERDNYVRINWQNVREGAERYFDVWSNATLDGTDYDFGSIMHCSPFMHSANGNAIIEPLTPLSPDIVIGQRSHLSQGDVERLNKFYC